ncbi:MAG: DUF1109 domain-containing protein [Rubrivivax sp.]|jgi:hypothetical protein|nr:DUF1109 domain-containing protein [Rubrivivax sp.]
MKTESLIEMLARGAGAAPKAVVERRVWPLAALGLVVSAFAGVVVLGVVPISVLAQGAWWLKFGYAVALVAAGGWLTVRLARPVQSLGAPQVLLLAALAAMGALGLWQWAAATPGQRLADLLGHSWSTCPRNVVLLSFPPMAAAFWALRGLAPTRPRLAGAAAGLLAGALGAAAYSLSCDELAMSFVAVWYTLGIAAATALGALLGPRLLRW